MRHIVAARVEHLQRVTWSHGIAHRGARAAGRGVAVVEAGEAHRSGPGRGDNQRIGADELRDAYLSRGGTVIFATRSTL